MSSYGYTETHCDLCGERFRDDADVAEMHHPELDEDSSICHVECGLHRDYVIA